MSARLDLENLVAAHKIWIFDCDGVILDSNKIKTEAFFEVVKGYGNDKAVAMVEYHKANGGISRFKKFEWFLKQIGDGQIREEELEALCNGYGRLVKQKLIDCPYTDGFEILLRILNTRGIKPYVVSGGFQDELIDVFKAKGISDKFEGIFGSPRDKRQILTEMVSARTLVGAGIFFGDAKADFLAAKDFEMRFVFVKKYSEALDWFATMRDEVAGIDTFLGLVS